MGGVWGVSGAVGLWCVRDGGRRGGGGGCVCASVCVCFLGACLFVCGLIFSSCVCLFVYLFVCGVFLLFIFYFLCFFRFLFWVC